MSLLLDTHIWLWMLRRDDRPGRAVRRQLERHREELYLSPVSIWEAGNVARKGRIKLKHSFSAWLDDALRRLPLKEAPFNFAVAREAARIELPQGDAGDVFLAATALVFDLTLVTADRQLIECSWLNTLADE